MTSCQPMSTCCSATATSFASSWPWRKVLACRAATDSMCEAGATQPCARHRRAAEAASFRIPWQPATVNVHGEKHVETTQAEKTVQTLRWLGGIDGQLRLIDQTLL